MVIRQQNYISSNTQSSFSSRSICGPFDTQFKKKFVGRQSSAINLQMKHVTRQPSLATLKLRHLESQTNLLPKIKEIQKIAKITSKKKGKIHQYVDGVSDLELYITKKVIDRRTTIEILSKIQQANSSQLVPKRTVFSLSQKKENSPETDIKLFEDINQETSNNQLVYKDLLQNEIKAKNLSDREFMDKFDKFIVRKHNYDKGKEMFVGERRMLSEQIRQKITEDQQMLTTIVKKMINQRGNFVEIQEDGAAVPSKEKSQVEKKKVEKNIEWIIRECSKFQSRFKNRKFKSKSKIKSNPKT